MKCPLVFDAIPKIGEWKIEPEDVIFSNTKNLVIAPISRFLQVNSNNLDYFVIRPKKCYNSQGLRDHICVTLNYFEKYFDKDKELLSCMARMKYMIDIVPEYSRENFLHDMRIYILSESVKNKVIELSEYNYSLDLTYKNIQAPLQYTNIHAKTLLEISVLMNCTIPLITHFAHVKRITEIDDFIMDTFDIILHMFPVDIFNKLYETAISNVTKSEYKNAVLWAKQDIRGKDIVTHATDSVDNIILNIMPKYAFDRNIVALNYTSIVKNTGCQITDIGFEYGFVSLSSSKREAEDNASEIDKFESNMIKQNEAIAIQNTVNCRETIKSIETMFGPFDQAELEFYRENLKNDTGNVINNFQKQLIFDLFYKYFGDTISIYFIDNGYEYIKMMLAAKKLLSNNFMVIMPYIISSKVEKLVTRKTINKREELKLKASPYYQRVVDTYRNEKVIQQILSNIATVISSNFRIIDYNNPDINGKMVNAIPDIVMEEMLAMTLMCK